MNKTRRLLLIAVSAWITWRANTYGTLQVVVQDERGGPVAEAEVHVGFIKPIPQGMGWGGGHEIKWQYLTETNGICTIRNMVSHELGIAVWKPSFYWWHSGRVSLPSPVQFSDDSAANQICLTAILVRVVNPIPLYARRAGWQNGLLLPREQPAGFDLIAGDWVEPHGTGKVADLVFELRRTVFGKDGRGHDLHETELRVTFANPGDGILAVPMRPLAAAGSELRLPREAPENGYESEWVQRWWRDERGSHSNLRNDRGYFLRVRSQVDSQGAVTNALYGKIQGDIECIYWEDPARLSFTYYLNPTPNDRNLEFDPKRNLFTNLKPAERVFAP